MDIEGDVGSDVDIKIEKKVLNCDTCSFKTRWRCSLARHKKSAHSKNAVSCSLCPRTFRNRYEQKQHEKNVHGERITCPHCLKVFKSQSGLTAHTRMLKGDFKYQCDVCFQTFVSKTHFEAHVNAHRGYKPHKCQSCKASFATKSSYNRHVHSCTSPNDKYHCDECNQSYSSKASLSVHMSGKHGDTLHTCEYCGKSYKWANSYYRHLKNHK